MVTIEELKTEALVDYCVAELNNVFESVVADDRMVRTSRSFCNAIDLWKFGDMCCMTVHGYITIQMPNVHAEYDGENIRIQSVGSIANQMYVPIEQCLKWLEEIRNQ